MSQYIAMIVVHAHDRYTARIACNFCGEFFFADSVKTAGENFHRWQYYSVKTIKIEEVNFSRTEVNMQKP